MKFGVNVVFKEVFDPYFFYRRYWETTPKVGHVSSNISKITEDAIFVLTAFFF